MCGGEVIPLSKLDNGLKYLRYGMEYKIMKYVFVPQ